MIDAEKRKASKREYYYRNKNRISEKRKAWTKQNPDKSKQYSIDSRERRPVPYILRGLRKRAKERGLEFNLEESDIVIPMICPYLKTPLYFSLGEGYKDNSVSIDRVDNTKGYIKGNIEVISTLANRMKSNSTPKQLEAFAIEVLRRAGKR